MHPLYISSAFSKSKLRLVDADSRVRPPDTSHRANIPEFGRPIRRIGRTFPSSDARYAASGEHSRVRTPDTSHRADIPKFGRPIRRIGQTFHDSGKDRLDPPKV